MDSQVYILGPQYSSFVRSVMLCCEEKGVNYEYGFKPNGQTIEFGGEQHLAMHPFAKVPVLIHNDRSVFETSSICRYIDATFDGDALQPNDPYERAEVDQWSQALSTYIDEAIVRKYLLELAFPKGENGSIRKDKLVEAMPAVMSSLEILEKQLGEKAFFCCNQFTIADAILIPIIDYIANLNFRDKLLAKAPSLDSYIQRMQERPSGHAVLTHSSK